MLYHHPAVHLAIHSASQAQRERSLRRAAAICCRQPQLNSRSHRSMRARLLALVLGAALGALACGDSVHAEVHGTSTPGNPPQPEASADEVAALRAARAFLAAFQERDSAAIVATMDPSWQATSGREFADHLGGAAAVTVLSLSIDRSRPVPMVAVPMSMTLDVVPSGHPGPWSAGVNTRFLLLVNEDAAGRVAGFGG